LNDPTGVDRTGLGVGAVVGPDFGLLAGVFCFTILAEGGVDGSWSSSSSSSSSLT